MPPLHLLSSMPSGSPRAIVIFARALVPGRVKTRLAGALSRQQAADVHRACLQDTISLVASVRGCRKWLLVAASARAARRLATKMRLRREWRVAPQSGRDLGARLERAFAQQFQARARSVVVIGSDSPWMGRARIERAFRRLERADAVLGPAADGGYYLVGLRRPLPLMFRNIPWGTSRVFALTTRRLKQMGASVALLEADFDLDRISDLRRASRLLGASWRRAPALARWLSNLWGGVKPTLGGLKSPLRSNPRGGFILPPGESNNPPTAENQSA